MLKLATDWTVVVCGGTFVDVRISHHLTMYYIIAWVMFHIYYQFWRSIFWQESDINIVVGGSKYIKTDDKK
jgi:Ni/Fe-hydrogenase 1 B-type cytochrome subunit